METLFFLINSIGYLLKTDLSILIKIKILLKIVYIYFSSGILNKIGKKDISFDGIKIHGIDYNSLFGLFLEIFVRNEYKFNTEKKNPLILDLGANIGIATMYFKWLYPKSIIYSFEPDKKHFNIFKKNIEKNKYKDVFIEEKAVTNYTGEIVFYTDDKASFSMSTKKGRMSKIETKVKCISILDIVKDNHIDLFKMDIEGGEFDVLELLDNSGKIKQINEFIIEYHHNIKDDNMSLSLFLNILEKNGFKYGLNTSLFPLDSKNKFQDIYIHAYKA